MKVRYLALLIAGGLWLILAGSNPGYGHDGSTPPTASAHARSVQELGPPSKGLTEDQIAGAKAVPPPAVPQLQAAAPSIQSDFVVFGYLQSEAQVFHTRWNSLTHVGSLFVGFNAAGNLTGTAAFTGRDASLRAGGAAQAAGVKFILVVASFDDASGGVIETVMTNASLRAVLINDIVNLITADSYCQGVSMDLEFSWGATVRDGITAFFQELRAALPSQYEISVYTNAILSTTQWNFNATTGITPNINYMLYSTYDWATGNTAHAISDFDNCDNYIEDYFNAGLPPSKMVLTWAAYARRWTGITTYNAVGASPSSRGFTDGLFDTTLNTNFGGPYASTYVTGDEGEWYTYNDGVNDYVVTWDSPATLEYKLRSSLVFPGDPADATVQWAGRRLRGVGYWSLYWLAESATNGSYTGNTLDGGPGLVSRTRTYPHVYQLNTEVFSPPGTTRYVFEGFEGSDPRWRDPNLTPDTVGDTDNNSVDVLVAAPAGTGRPASTTNAMQVTFDFEGSTGNKLVYRHEVLASSQLTSVVDTNATVVRLDSNTKVLAYIYTPAAYSGYQVRMLVLDANRQLEASDPYTLNASGWRLIEWDLTDAGQINAFTTSEWGLTNGNGTLNTAGGAKKDIGFFGFVIEGNGAIAGNVVFDELAYQHANPGGRNYNINEVRYNGTGNPAATTGEFVEIYGPAGAVPASFQLRVIAGADGSATTFNLAGATIPDDGGGFGFLVVGDPGTPNVDVSAGFSTAVDDLLDANPTGLQLYDTATGCVYDSVVYEAWGGLRDLVRQQALGVTGEGYPWTGQIAGGTNSAGVAYSMGRYPNGADTNWNNADLAVQPANPGASNSGSITLPFTSDFTAAPSGPFQTFQAFSVANPVTAGLPASPNGGNAHRCVDTTGGGVISYFGDAALGAGGTGYTVTGQLYIPAGAAPAQAIAVGLCGRQGSNFFTTANTSLVGSAYESGYWLIYENGTVGRNDGRPDHSGTFEVVHATHDNLDATPVTLLGSATLAATGATAGAWTPFELTIDPNAPAGQQLIAKINTVTVASVSLPSGGPTSGAFQVGFRENHTGGPAAAEGTWIDALAISPLTQSPSITTHPVSQIRTVGQSVTFTVAASGTPTLHYQWYKVGTPDTPVGTDSSSYTIPSVTTGNAGDYYCVVSNAYPPPAQSNNATLTVNVPVNITTHPASQTKVVGDSVTFTVAATGTLPLTYQWYKVGTPNTPVGTDSPSYTIASVTAGNAGQYFCRVSNVVGPVDSNQATLTVNVPVNISTHPASQAIQKTGSVTFIVVASGTAPITYQWYKVGAPDQLIPGATSDSYTINPVLDTSAGQYYCRVTNPAGSVNSDSATLTVLPPARVEEWQQIGHR